MSRSTACIKSVLLSLLILQASSQGERPLWNQFRGPEGSGVATGCRPPLKIDPRQPTWAVDVPIGQSSPVVDDNQLFLTAIDEDRLLTIAIDLETGNENWRVLAPESPLERVHESSSPAASTPCVDGDRLFVYFGSFGLICYDLDGKEVWRRPIATPKSLYGMSCSPIVDGNVLYMVLDDDANLPESSVSRSKIIALDKASGELVWETPRPFHRSGWSTPTVWHHSKGSELVVLGNARVRGYDAKTGDEKWFAGGFSRETIARPIVNGDVVLVSASMIGGIADDQPDPAPFWEAVLHFDANGDKQLQRNEMTKDFTFPFRPHLPAGHPGFGLPLPKNESRRKQILDGMFTGIDKDQDGSWTRGEFLTHISFNRGKPNLMAIRPGGVGDILDTHVEWSLHRGIPEIPTPILFEDRIYLVSDGGVFTAVDASSGSILYRKRLGATGHFRASPVIADQHLYAISETGVMSVVRTGDEFDRVHQCDFGQRIAATPAIDSQTIYIRTDEQLLAFRRE